MSEHKLYRAGGALYRAEPNEGAACRRCDLEYASGTCSDFPCLENDTIAKLVPPSLPIPDSVKIVELRT